MNTGEESRRVHPLRDDGLGNTSYLVDAGDGLAVAVDPPRDVGPHYELADRLGLRIVASLETHLHADFVSGSRELGDRLGAEAYGAREGHLGFAHTGLGDGEVVRIGEAEITALHTPGHTPEHLSFLLGAPGDPEAVFTGGSLIGGGAARTDLISPARTDELARAQFSSFRRLASLPDAVEVYPTHGAGSFCSIGDARGPLGTIGDQRRVNPLLGIDDEDAFVRELVRGYGSFPPYFLCLREVNRSGPRLLRTLAPPAPLDAARAHDLTERGAWLIDARPIADWAREHPSGAVSIELRPAFASWLGWVVPFGERVVLLLDAERVPEAASRARGVGYDLVDGFIDGGMEAWRAAGLPTGSVAEIDVNRAAELRGDVTFVDVRQASEAALGRIPGSVHLELGDIVAGATPDADEVVTLCAHGERSATAASLLERRGIAVTNFVGGFQAWQEAGLPVER